MTAHEIIETGRGEFNFAALNPAWQLRRGI
jgi:hypothetical protein